MIYHAINSDEFDELSEKIECDLVECAKVGEFLIVEDYCEYSSILYLVNCDKRLAFKVNDENNRILLFEDEAFDHLPKKFLRGMTVEELRQFVNGFFGKQITFGSHNNETIIWWSVEPQRIELAHYCLESDGEPFGQQMLSSDEDQYMCFYGCEAHSIDDDHFPYNVRITFEAHIDEFCRLLYPIEMKITRKDDNNIYVTAAYTSENKIVDVVRSLEAPKFGASFDDLYGR